VTPGDGNDFLLMVSGLAMLPVVLGVTLAIYWVCGMGLEGLANLEEAFRAWLRDRKDGGR
jgi:hypothetical protein